MPNDARGTFCRLVAGLALAVLASAAAGIEPDPSLADIYERVQRTDPDHPITDLGWHIHDPSDMVVIDGWELISATGKEVSQAYRSGIELWFIGPDDDGWTPGQLLLSDKPAWQQTLVPNNPGAYWAPCFAGPRRIYYSVSNLCDNEDDDCEEVTAVGMIDGAGSPPAMAWTDAGVPITHSILDIEAKVPASIDPSFFTDRDGTSYIVHGGGFIYAARLNAAGRIDGPARCDPEHDAYTHLASPPTRGPFGDGEGEPHWIEAPFLYERDGWFYLFVNWHGCCNGVLSTYEIRVGRSRSVTGPFLDADAVDMRDGGGTLVMDRAGVLIGDARIIGPGHPAVRDDDGAQLMTFHYYDGANEGAPWIGEVQLNFDTGWPIAMPASDE